MSDLEPGPAPASPTIYLRVGIYIVLYVVAASFAVPAMHWLGGYLLGITLGQFVSALSANWISLRIYGRLRWAAIGLMLNRASAINLALGIAGGMGSAALVLFPPLAMHAARLVPASQPRATWDVFLFTSMVLLMGAAAEEILFRGYGFQLLLGLIGPFTAIFTVGALFGLLHGMNPHSTWLGIVNTAGFGVLFGCAFLRSRDLWLPIGLHFGWNFTLPLFGVNLSGLTMKLTGYEIEWNTSPVWSGGAYGPEGSVLTTIVLLALSLYIWKAPIRTQQSEVLLCAPGSSPLPS